MIQLIRNENEDNLISISDDYKSLFFDLKYDFGYSYYLIQLQRKLFPDENFENSISINGSNFKDNNNILINYNLDEIIFSPNYVIIGYINLKLEYSTTNLIFKNEEAFKLYGTAFCSNFQNPMNLKSTIQFNCIENNDNKSYKVISPISEPGVLETQLKKYTNVTTLNIIRVDFENDCQDIYNNIDKLEDVFINLYFPLNLNKNEIKVLYNNDESLVIKNNIEIENNTFDYTLIPFYIKKENIKNNGIAEIFYQNNKIKSIYIGYSIAKLPTLINRFLE